MKYECCPVCLHSLPLVVTSCGHHFCQCCLERILSTCKHIAQEYDDDHVDEIIINSCTIRGRCPMCRDCIDLFEVKDADGNFVFQRNKIIPDQLCGMSFSNHDDTFKISFASNSFDPPSITIINPNESSDMSVRNEIFNGGYNFNTKRNTFVGKVSLEKSVLPGAINQFEVIAQFSRDYRHVSRGIIIIKRDMISVDDIRTLYPLDGTWIVRWQRYEDRGKDKSELDSAKIKVSANQFSFYGHSYCINLGTSEQPKVHFHWKLNGVISATQIAESGVDLIHEKTGPNVGETITWTVDNNADIFRIFWTRDSISSPPTRTVKVLGSAGMLVRRDQYCASGSKPSYNGKSIWGNVFIQGLKVGLASYHFISENGVGENGSFISYENIDCSQWPPLDDGTPVPSRVPFVETSFDSISRLFRGSISWKEICGSSWNGSYKWEYEMIFDTEYLAIISGSVKDITDNGTTIQTHIFNRDLIYINAALSSRINTSIDVEEPNPDGEIRHRDNINDITRHAMLVRSEIMSIKSRLIQEGASSRTLELIFNGSRGALSPELDTIDYNL